jgi:hypothetical protein
VGCVAVAGGGRRWSGWSGVVGGSAGVAARLFVVVDAKDGGEGLGLVPSQPGLELTAAASNGAGGGSTAARPEQEGGAPLYGRPGSSSVTTRPSATSMGARAGLGRNEWQGGLERTDGPPGVPGRTARGARRGEDFETVLGRAWLRGTSLGKARGGSDAEAGGCRRARRGCPRERVRGRFLFGVPLFELDFLQTFE